MSSFSKFFIYSHKQVANMSWGRHDTVTREICDHYSLNINILGKAACSILPLLPFAAGAMPTQPADY
jgi:hypothetical protein